MRETVPEPARVQEGITFVLGFATPARCAPACSWIIPVRPRRRLCPAGKTTPLQFHLYAPVEVPRSFERALGAGLLFPAPRKVS